VETPTRVACSKVSLLCILNGLFVAYVFRSPVPTCNLNTFTHQQSIRGVERLVASYVRVPCLCTEIWPVRAFCYIAIRIT